MFGILITALIAISAGLVFLGIGNRVVGTDGQAPAPRVGYAVGWAAIGAVLVTDGLRHGLALASEPSLPLYQALVWMKIIFTGTAISGFGVYIVYAWTASRPMTALAAGIGILHAGYWLTVTTAGMPGRLIVGDWGTRMEFQSTGLGTLGIVMFLLPFVAIMAAYAGFWRHVGSPGQRLRLALVSGSLLMFVFGASVQGNPDTDPNGAWLPGALSLILFAAVVARIAFDPPRRLQQRWGLEPYAHGVVGVSQGAHSHFRHAATEKPISKKATIDPVTSQ